MRKFFSKKIVSLITEILLLTALLCIITGCKKKVDTSNKENDEQPEKVDSITEKENDEHPKKVDSITENKDETTIMPALTPVEYYGEMLVQGNEIIGSKTNNYVQVTGMSFFWSNWSQRFYTAEMVEKMVNEYNCEVIRTPYGIQDNGLPYDISDIERIKTVVQAAIDNGVYIIIDWHSHGAHNQPEEATKFFSMMAKEFGSYDNVIFELYNEPKDVQWPAVKAYAEKVIPEIRKYSDNLIIVGTPTWSQDVDIAAEDPVDGENIAYALHFYAGTHTQFLRDKADKAMNNGIALFVTEWGSVDSSGDGDIDYTSTTEWINWKNENHLSWCAWAVNDKAESSSIFNSAYEYTETGNLLKAIIADCTAESEWKTGVPKPHKPLSYTKPN